MNRIEINETNQFDGVANVRVTAPTLERIHVVGGSNPVGQKRIDVDLGRDSRHLIIHDVHDVFWRGRIKGGMIYNVLIYNVGWQSSDPRDPRAGNGGGHGHPLYCQNDGAEARLIDSCVFMAGFAGTAGKVYAEKTDTMKNVTFRATMFIGGHLLIGGTYYAASAITIDACVFLQSGLRLGYSAGNESASLTGSLLTHGLRISQRAVAGIRHPRTRKLVSWETLTVRDNTFVLKVGDTVEVALPSPDWAWDNNIYYSEDERPFVLQEDNGDPNSWQTGTALTSPERLSFAEWQARTGFDANSRFVLGKPDAPIVRVVAIEGGGAHIGNIAVYNPLDADTVAVDLSGLTLQKGNYVLRGVQDYDGAARPFVYDGAPVNVRMAGNVAPPIGWNAPHTPPGVPGNLFPRMAAFRVERADDDEQGRVETPIVQQPETPRLVTPVEPPIVAVVTAPVTPRVETVVETPVVEVPTRYDDALAEVRDVIAQYDSKTKTTQEVIGLIGSALAAHGVIDSVIGTGGKVSFNPASIAGLVLHLDASTISGLSDGQAVAQWSDLSGSGRHVTQATGANQPTYRTGVQNGRAVVRFDGTNDGLARTGMSGISAARNLVAIVAKSSTSGGERFTFTARQSLGAAVLMRLLSGTHRIQQRGLTVSAANAPTTWQLHLSYNDSSSVTYRRSGTLIGTATGTLGPNTAPVDMYVGNEINTNFWNGDISEILWYTSATDFDAAAITALEAHLRAKWGL